MVLSMTFAEQENVVCSQVGLASSILDTRSSRPERRFQFVAACAGWTLHVAVLEIIFHDGKARGYSGLPQRFAEGKRLVFLLLSGPLCRY